MPAEYKVILAQDNQCLFDIALQEYGTIEASGLLIADNNYVNNFNFVFSSSDRVRIRLADPAKDVATAVSIQSGRTSVATISSKEDSVLGSFDSSFNKSYA